uniref:Uncharacterized protein n=1 Tax=Arundo donax TaxID=35708 RepID=A0A0A9DXF4_ARUDO
MAGGRAGGGGVGGGQGGGRGDGATAEAVRERQGLGRRHGRVRHLPPVQGLPPDDGGRVGPPGRIHRPRGSACRRCSQTWRPWNSRQHSGDVIAYAPAYADDTDSTPMATRGRE